MAKHSHNFLRFTGLCGLMPIATIACAATTTLIFPSPSKIIIVRSKEVEPYKQAETAFSQNLPAQTEVKSLSLADATPQDLAKEAQNPGTAFFAIGTEAADAVKHAVPPTTPLACAMVADPAGAGLYEGRATTAISMDIPCADQVKLIANSLPKVRKLGVLYRSNTAKGKRAVDSMRAALPSGWSLEAVAVDKESSVADAVNKLFATNSDMVWTYPDCTLYDVATIKSILLESLRKNTPVFGFSASFVRAGAIIGVGTTPADQGRQAAGAIVDAPGHDGDGDDLIVPPQLRTYVNTVVAERLGITLPGDVIQSAAMAFKGD